MAALLRAKGAAKKPSAHGHGHSHGHGQGYPHTRAPEHGASASKYAFEEDMEMNLLPGGLASPEKELRPLVSDTRTPTVGEPGPRQMSSELCADAAMVPRRNLVGARAHSAARLPPAAASRAACLPPLFSPSERGLAGRHRV